MIHQIGFTLVFLLMPALVLKLCRKVKWIGKLGPVLTLYILGVVIGNVGNMIGVPLTDRSHTVQRLLSSATVPFAIPLMMLGCTFSKGDLRRYLSVLVTGLLAVVVAIIGGFFIFGPSIDSSNMAADGAAKIGGLLAGSYTGGTINMAALKTMLGVTDSTYLLINSYDMAIGFIYLVFLMSFGINLSRKFIGDNKSLATKISEKMADTRVALKTRLSKYIRDEKNWILDRLPEKFAGRWKTEEPEVEENPSPYKDLGTKNGLCVLAKLVIVSLVICALSFLVQMPFREPGEGLNMTVFILALTTISIGASFVPKLRTLPYSYDVGMYSIYVFSIVVASMADVRNFDFTGGLGVLGYLAFVVFVSLAIQAVLSRLLRLDADTTVIGSVALLCSPPFVPMISASMKNKRALTAGLAIGIVGYAVGTYLGYAMFRLLDIL